jgi:hypothetical protein
MVPSDRGATLSATRLLQAESERLRLAAARSRSGRAPVVSGPSGHAPALPATAGVFRVSVGAVEIRGMKMTLEGCCLHPGAPTARAESPGPISCSQLARRRCSPERHDDLREVVSVVGVRPDRGECFVAEAVAGGKPARTVDAIVGSGDRRRQRSHLEAGGGLPSSRRASSVAGSHGRWRAALGPEASGLARSTEDRRPIGWRD